MALDSVDLVLRPGEVHALVGENGAGKSTLAKILSGALRCDSGEMTLFGTPYEPRSRSQGSASGVAYVRQQLSLVQGLTLAQNLQLGRPGAPVGYRPESAREELGRVAARFALRVEPDRLVEDLPLADRQRAEILMAVAWGASILLLDEPSSALGPQEVDALLELCSRLREEGRAVLYISHKLREVSQVADRLTVLRQGRVVAADQRLRDMDMRQVGALMIGDLPVARSERPRPLLGNLRLYARDLHVSAAHGPGLRGVTLSVRGGEIVGVVGVAGNGQDELALVLSGLEAPDRGEVHIDARKVTGSAPAAVDAGLAFLPENRSDGLAMDLTLADNATAKRSGDGGLSRFGLRRLGAVRELARRLLHRFEVRPARPELLTGTLSGGNQQKLLAARELSVLPSVLVAMGPTKGLDPMATAVMRDRIFAVARSGGAVVVITADLDEVLDLAHRVIVLSGGVITDQFPIEECEPERLGAAMSGIET